MTKHSQTIRRQQPTNCLSVSDHFERLVLKGKNISRRQVKKSFLSLTKQTMPIQRKFLTNTLLSLTKLLKHFNIENFFQTYTDRLRISLLIISKFKGINLLLLPLKFRKF